MNTYIKSYGYAKTMMQDNNNKTINETQWMGDYDGEKLKLNIDTSNNGKNESINIKLTNEDLLDLLKKKPSNMELEDRLLNDFFREDPVYIMNYKKYKPIHHSRKRKNKKSKRSHRNKSKKSRVSNKTHTSKKSNNSKTSKSSYTL